jgi:cysteine desulfurase
VNTPIYMDNHATTPVDPRVLKAMLPYFTEKFGNAASRNHAFGWESEAAVDTAREQVRRLIGAASPREIVFTSGATESDNLAIKGVAEASASKGNHIVTCAVEHKAVLDSCKVLEKRGLSVTYLPVDSQGVVDLDRVREAITPRTILISIMSANNEIGTIEPITEIGRVAREKGVLFHTDATQAVGNLAACHGLHPRRVNADRDDGCPDAQGLVADRDPSSRQGSSAPTRGAALRWC